MAPEVSRATLDLRAVFDHLAFLLSSAELCQQEPHYYGTVRLLDGASRFARAVMDAGVADAKLVELSRHIDAAKSVRKSDPEAYQKFLHRLPAEVAEVIKGLPPVRRA